MSDAGADDVRERFQDYRDEAEAHGFANVGDFWRWRAAQKRAAQDVG